MYDRNGLCTLWREVPRLDRQRPPSFYIYICTYMYICTYISSHSCLYFLLSLGTLLPPFSGNPGIKNRCHQIGKHRYVIILKNYLNVCLIKILFFIFFCLSAQITTNVSYMVSYDDRQFKSRKTQIQWCKSTSIYFAEIKNAPLIVCMCQITVIRFGGFDSLDLIGNRSCLIHTEKWAFRFSQDETSIPYPCTGHPTVFPPTPRT